MAKSNIQAAGNAFVCRLTVKSHQICGGCLLYSRRSPMDDSFGKNIHRRRRGEKKLLLTWNVTLESGSNDKMNETIMLWISPESGDEQDIIRMSTARMNCKDTIVYNGCALLLAKCCAENSDEFWNM